MHSQQHSGETSPERLRVNASSIETHRSRPASAAFLSISQKNDAQGAARCGRPSLIWAQGDYAVARVRCEFCPVRTSSRYILAQLLNERVYLVDGVSRASGLSESASIHDDTNA
jgi:hypothetical protein